MIRRRAGSSACTNVMASMDVRHRVKGAATLINTHQPMVLDTRIQAGILGIPVGSIASATVIGMTSNAPHTAAWNDTRAIFSMALPPATSTNVRTARMRNTAAQPKPVVTARTEYDTGHSVLRQFIGSCAHPGGHGVAMTVCETFGQRNV